MIILGISCFFHDAAACLLDDGVLVAAASEERFTRKKHDADFPVHAVEYCLRQAGILISEVDYLAFHDKPFRKFDRILTSYLATFPRSTKAFLQALPLWTKRKLRLRELVRQEVFHDGPILFGEHHLSHAASAFFASPFDEAAILTVDGVGEWDTACYGMGLGREIRLPKELRYPHSLGLLYNAFTHYLGFEVNSAEYKVMGLAAYGEPAYADEIRRLIDIKDDGSFSLDLSYFSFHYGLRMTSRRFHNLFGGTPRLPESPLDKRHCDIAASIQRITEEVLLKQANHLYKETKLQNICLAGGVALNCVANGRMQRETPFEHIYVQPAADDAGGALGAALHVHHGLLGNARRFRMDHTYWGPEYSRSEVRRFLRNEDIPFQESDNESLVATTARLIAQGKIVGWFQGRMEFGPRALGNRSILADPRRAEMKELINRQVKFREDFRPFAPAVLVERAAEYFEINYPSPFMTFAVPVRENKRHEIAAVTHVDGSARIQTVSRDCNPLFYDLIKQFDNVSGCPLLINTSFNVRGEPIVCTPREALTCFMRTGMDCLVIENFMIDKRHVKNTIAAKQCDEIAHGLNP